eukprot:CAMPEP_0198339690 /NCGR_PEP_ID=MMETSP1450-20131203/41444_1 /TAXON_ID=753684 ORGANISM="Madagascaria erythrocladiodes, Strain CCMP3234" /NCGR_SAMPLE_ID=MMETSP1450 /ASSEMBLY_ACC=CAM_ASM_001115 /LENGTH=203 /DNA_ID=CAMNT_0044044635 /DNA_START=145 /DNA_END=752 /DNA_ORIENTATION=+
MSSAFPVKKITIYKNDLSHVERRASAPAPGGAQDYAIEVRLANKDLAVDTLTVTAPPSCSTVVSYDSELAAAARNKRAAQERGETFEFDRSAGIKNFVRSCVGARVDVRARTKTLAGDSTVTAVSGTVALVEDAKLLVELSGGGHTEVTRPHLHVLDDDAVMHRVALADVVTLKFVDQYLQSQLAASLSAQLEVRKPAVVATG